MTRWTLGASDIMFTHPYVFAHPTDHTDQHQTARLLSAFFRSGQVLETFRGQGVYQPAVDVAIELLNRGAWVRPYLAAPFPTRSLIP